MSEELQIALKDIAHCASQSGINLNGFVDRHGLYVRGASALVYQGTLRPAGARIAVKTILSGTPSLKKDIIEEAVRRLHTLSQVDHQNVLPLLGLTTEFYFNISIVSAWMENGNAHDYVQEQSVDPRPLIDGIAQGLLYLHTYKQGPIVHGNLKGSNVLISPEGRALLTDFGLYPVFNSTLTVSLGISHGRSMNWMPPEYVDIGEVTAKGDVWAFAMTALELFTRRVPFHDRRSMADTARAVVEGQFNRPDMGDTYSRFTDGWWNLCCSCLNRDMLLRPSMSVVVTRISLLSDISQAPHKILAKHAYEHYINLDGRLQRQEDSCLLGTIAKVFKGTLLPEGTKVAVKTINGTLHGSEKTIQEAVRKIHIWSKLRHPNVLPFLGITTEFDQTISIVSPWVDKGNAHDYVQDRTIDPRSLLAGIARGLEYLHNYKPHPIFHGDLKGANVLISDEGQALLSDFEHSRAVNSFLHITFTEPSGGSLNWMAPEILDSGEMSAESDVWAFGMIALELFTAKVPFYDRKTTVAIVTAIVMGPPGRPGMGDTVFRLTDEWWELCCSCWAPRPKSRPHISNVVKIISRNTTGMGTELVNQRTRVLRISAIEIRNVSGGQSAELTVAGKLYKLPEQVEKGVIRVDFYPFLEAAIEEQLSLLVTSPGMRWTQRTEISFDPRDILSRSRDNKFVEMHRDLRISLEICPPDDRESLIPTTDELSQCPYLRILVLGKSGIGKTTLINRIFGIEDVEPSHGRRGIANIEKPLVSKLNRSVILHQSRGFEPGESDNLAVVKSFIERCKNSKDIKDQLHAIWLIFQIPLESQGRRMMEAGMEEFLGQKRSILGDIPAVFVFTKYDRLTDAIESKWVDEGRNYTIEDVNSQAAQYLREQCVQRIQKFTGERDIAYIAVSSKRRYQARLKELIQLTSDMVSGDNKSSAVSMVFVTAQRVNPMLKISESANVGRQKYWGAVLSGDRFSGQKIIDCLRVIHTDIVKVWNFWDPNELLQNKDFRESILDLVDLVERDRQNDTSAGDKAGVIAAMRRWREPNWARGRKEYRKFMAYIVDLTHIMDILFTLLDGENGQEITLSNVRVAIGAYRDSNRIRDVHAEALAKTRYDTDAELKELVEMEKKKRTRPVPTRGWMPKAGTSRTAVPPS